MRLFPSIRRRVAVPDTAGWISRDGYRFSPTLEAVEEPELRPEPLDLLAGEVIDRHVRAGRRGLAICGPAAGAGVSFIAANLAVALSQSKVATLLVDANLHAPALDNLVQPPAPRGGLYEALTDSDALRMHSVTHREVLPNLALMYAGHPEPGASELIAGEGFARLVERCLRDFECVIFDTPPANRSPDARVVAAAAGYAMLVSRRGASHADDMTMLAQQLDHDGVSILGSVLNGA